MITPTIHEEANKLTIKEFIDFLYTNEALEIEKSDLKLLSFFCSYLISAPDSKYTFSYYDGKIELFKSFLIHFKQKLENYVTVFKHLHTLCIDNNITNDDLYLVFDESIIFYFDLTKSFELTDNSNISKISTNGLILSMFRVDNQTKTVSHNAKVSQKDIDNKTYLKHLEDHFLFFTALK
jgi:hypothetical protein